MTASIDTPGCVALVGSGETSPNGGRIFEELARRLSAPLPIAVLETPAGFEPNSAQVAGRVADFLRNRLQNYAPEIAILPARKRNTAWSPDDSAIAQLLWHADLITLGPGSPTYAVRQLDESLVWHTVLACHRLGAAIALASASVIAASAFALPVYEIYKVGADLFWHKGLDLFGPFGLSLVFIPHWNNNDGGVELDTSRCYLGRARFAELLAMLPPQMTVVGIDEHTGLIIDLQAATGQVLGRGGVTLLKEGYEQTFDHGETFLLHELGPFRPPTSPDGIPAAVWDHVYAARVQAHPATLVPTEVLSLIEQRQQQRTMRNWSAADELRLRIVALGWQVEDTPDGPLVKPQS
jgi:hypothetical protein